MAEATLRRATYADLEAVPDHLVAEIIDGALETHPRPRPEMPWRRLAWPVNSDIPSRTAVADPAAGSS